MMNRAGELIVRIIKISFAFLLIILFFPFPSKAAEPVSVSAKAAVLYDPLCDAVIWGKNETAVLGMASTTKIMTAVVAMELYDPNKVVEIHPDWCGIEGSSIYLKAGEKLTVSDLLYGLLLSSGNDAAVALAGFYSGNIEDFVACMNAKAEELGLENTHFTNPSGLSEAGHHTTPLELARLTAYAMRQPLFAEIVATEQYVCGSRVFQNHNKLLQQINACGVKTGYTKADGRCLVSAKEENGRMLIAVTLSAPDDWKDHKELYELGFSAFTPSTPVEEGTLFYIPVTGGINPEVAVYSTESYTVLLHKDVQKDVTVRILGPRFVYPEQVKGGKYYGRVQVRCNNALLFESDLYYANSVPAKGIKITIWQQFLDWLCCLLG